MGSRVLTGVSLTAPVYTWTFGCGTTLMHLHGGLQGATLPHPHSNCQRSSGHACLVTARGHLAMHVW